MSPVQTRRFPPDLVLQFWISDLKAMFGGKFNDKCFVTVGAGDRQIAPFFRRQPHGCKHCLPIFPVVDLNLFAVVDKGNPANLAITGKVGIADGIAALATNHRMFGDTSNVQQQQTTEAR